MTDGSIHPKDALKEAAKILKAVVASQSKFVPQAKSYLAAIEGGGELPPLPAGRNRATVSRPAALTTSGSSSP